MEPIVLAVLVGLAAYMAIVAVIPRRFFSDGDDYTRNMLAQLEREGIEKLSVVSGGDILRKPVMNLTFLTRLFLTFPGAKSIYPRLLKAGLAGNMDTFVIVLLLVFVLLVFAFRGFGFWGVLLALGVIYLGAHFYIRRLLSKRNEAFINLFPDALDMVVRSVRSGYPLNAAVRMVAENMQPPVSTEFKQVADETAYGSSLIDALTRLSQRIDEPDIRFFVIVLAVQQEVGGNLAEVLSNLSSIIRKRRHLRMKIRALTSEGRASAWVLGSLPLFVFTVIYAVSPHHLDPLFETPLGRVILAAAVGIVGLGAFIVSRLINIRV